MAVGFDLSAFVFFFLPGDLEAFTWANPVAVKGLGGLGGCVRVRLGQHGGGHFCIFGHVERGTKFT